MSPGYLRRDPGPATTWLPASHPQAPGPLHSETPELVPKLREIPLKRTDVDMTKKEPGRIGLEGPNDKLPNDSREDAWMRDCTAWMTLIQFSRAE